MKIAFFGTDEFSINVISELITNDIKIDLIITVPDAPKGRGLVLTPPPIKNFSSDKGIEIIQPEKLDDDCFEKLSNESWDLFIVASYGKIIPERFIKIPKSSVLNVHPSLLPKYRGTSPIESQIMSGDQNIGVTIMKMDKEMDHGPILAERKVEYKEYFSEELYKMLSTLGGKIISEILPDYISGKLTGVEQNHDLATFTKKIKKEDGEVSLTEEDDVIYRKYRALKQSVGLYFYTIRRGNKIRVKINEAEFKDGKFELKEVTPEGGKRMSYESFLLGL
jgi:methionyl-tRNA formyltransferase